MSEQKTKTLSEVKHWQIRAMAAEKQRKQLLLALHVCLRFMSPRCAYLNHDARDQHGSASPCPVEERIKKQVRAVTERRGARGVACTTGAISTSKPGVITRAGTDRPMDRRRSPTRKRSAGRCA